MQHWASFCCTMLPNQLIHNLSDKIETLQIRTTCVTNYTNSDGLAFNLEGRYGELNLTITKILVVDDDDDLLAMLKEYLVRHTFAVHIASTPEAVHQIMNTNHIDIILLDVMLGNYSGFQVCQDLRVSNTAPIIMMSALSADQHRMEGYACGADDYVAKPFNPDLLLARIRAVLRRTHRSASLSYRRENKIYHFSDWHFNARTEELCANDGFEVALSQREIGLIKTFLANPHIPLTREEIAGVLDHQSLSETMSETVDGRAIDVLVGRLRCKIEPDPKSPTLIKTVRGTGYMFANDVQIDDVS